MGEQLGHVEEQKSSVFDGEMTVIRESGVEQRDDVHEVQCS